MSDTKKRNECTETRFCSALEERARGQGGTHRRGFVDESVVQGYLGKSTPSPIWYVDADQATPLYVKFCPFCGFNHSARVTKFEAELKKTAEKLAG